VTTGHPHPHHHPHPASVRPRRRLSSFRHAAAGIRHAVATQPNFRFQLAAAAAALAAGAFFSIDRLEWVALLLAILLVLICEMINTVLELTMDRISDQFHPLAKAAKDVAAGSVLLAAAGSVVVGALIFIPRIALLTEGSR
jgi:diacylglycerol kinase